MELVNTYLESDRDNIDSLEHNTFIKITLPPQPKNHFFKTTSTKNNIEEVRFEESKGFVLENEMERKINESEQKKENKLGIYNPSVGGKGRQPLKLNIKQFGTMIIKKNKELIDCLTDSEHSKSKEELPIHDHYSPTNELKEYNMVSTLKCDEGKSNINLKEQLMTNDELEVRNNDLIKSKLVPVKVDNMTNTEPIVDNTKNEIETLTNEVKRLNALIKEKDERIYNIEAKYKELFEQQKLNLEEKFVKEKGILKEEFKKEKNVMRKEYVQKNNILKGNNNKLQAKVNKLEEAIKNTKAKLEEEQKAQINELRTKQEQLVKAHKVELEILKINNKDAKKLYEERYNMIFKKWKKEQQLNKALNNLKIGVQDNTIQKEIELDKKLVEVENTRQELEVERRKLLMEQELLETTKYKYEKIKEQIQKEQTDIEILFSIRKKELEEYEVRIKEDESKRRARLVEEELKLNKEKIRYEKELLNESKKCEEYKAELDKLLAELHSTQHQRYLSLESKQKELFKKELELVRRSEACSEKELTLNEQRNKIATNNKEDKHTLELTETVNETINVGTFINQTKLKNTNAKKMLSKTMTIADECKVLNKTMTCESKNRLRISTPTFDASLFIQSLSQKVIFI